MIKRIMILVVLLSAGCASNPAIELDESVKGVLVVTEIKGKPMDPVHTEPVAGVNFNGYLVFITGNEYERLVRAEESAQKRSDGNGAVPSDETGGSKQPTGPTESP